MAKLLLQQAARQVGAGKTALLRLVGAGRREAVASCPSSVAPSTPFAGIDAMGDTPEALRAELEELRALLDQMRAERSRRVA
jgi:hypothetical protein